MQLLAAHPDFRRLWLAQTVSQIGSQVSYLALPLVAAVALDASPAQMGLLAAAGSLPALVVGLFAGALVDRRARRPVLVGADLFRAGLLALVPLAWWAGVLTIDLLLAVAFLGGLGTLLFDIAYQAFLPAVLDRERLVEGNSRLELSRSAAEVAGPGLAGGLVQLLSAPVALLADAASFLLSAHLIRRIRTPEPPVDRAGQPSLLADVRAGLRATLAVPELRALAGAGALLALANAAIEAVVVLYLVREVGLAPGVLGLVFAAGSAGFVLGALLPGRIVARLGVGPAMALALVVVGLSDLLVPLAGRGTLAVAAVVGLAQACFGLGITLFRVAQASLRQALVPTALMGRVVGTTNVLAWSAVPLGALLGGLAGAGIGLRPTLVLASLAEAAVALWIWRSRLWHHRTLT